MCCLAQFSSLHTLLKGLLLYINNPFPEQIPKCILLFFTLGGGSTYTAYTTYHYLLVFGVLFATKQLSQITSKRVHSAFNNIVLGIYHLALKMSYKIHIHNCLQGEKGQLHFATPAQFSKTLRKMPCSLSFFTFTFGIWSYVSGLY